MKPAARARAVSKPAKRRKRRFRPFVWAFRAVMAAALLLVGWIGFMLWTITSFEPDPLDEQYDVGIVLGAALWRNEPSPGLRERLDHALALYQAGKFDKLIVTGGQEGTDLREEARVVVDHRVVDDLRAGPFLEGLQGRVGHLAADPLLVHVQRPVRPRERAGLLLRRPVEPAVGHVSSPLQACHVRFEGSRGRGRGFRVRESEVQGFEGPKV